MYIDKTIPLLENIPSRFIADDKILNEYYEADDWYKYDNKLNEMKINIKTY